MIKLKPNTNPSARNPGMYEITMTPEEQEFHLQHWRRDMKRKGWSDAQIDEEERREKAALETLIRLYDNRLAPTGKENTNEPK